MENMCACGDSCIMIEHCGGSGGKYWSYKPDDGVIVQVIIVYGEVIDSVRFKILKSDGSIEYSPKFGGKGGDRTTKVDIDYPLEYLTEMNGTCGRFGSNDVITSLHFKTNVATHGPFGSGKSGSPFWCPINNGAIVGFFGHSGGYLDNIGIYVKPVCSFCATKPTQIEVPTKEEAGKGGELTHDERIIIAGALQLAEKTAKDAMTPISKAFSLDLDETLTSDTLNAITTMGHSRVPVYYKDPRNIIGLILVKNLLAVDPENETLLRKMLLRKIPRVSENMPLYDILNEFQKGHSHIAVVYKDINEFQKDSQDQATEPDTCKASTDENQLQKKSSLQTPAFKKRHKGCSFCILDLVNNPIPELISNQQVVGVITMEDVIEELIQEEILDETDEYANIHGRIRVNVHPKQENDSDSYSALPFLASAPLSVFAA